VRAWEWRRFGKAIFSSKKTLWFRYDYRVGTDAGRRARGLKNTKPPWTAGRHLYKIGDDYKKLSRLVKSFSGIGLS
jgi:hypothetical protein